MKEVARFYDPEEAQIAAGFLKAQGLDVHLADEQTLTTLPHLSVGLGGYRIVAEERDANLAQRLLADVKAEDKGRLHCERCGSSRISRIRDIRLPVMFGFLAILFPFAPPTDMLRCRACGHKQPVTDEEETVG